MNVVDNIQNTINELGDIDLSGISLESCEGSLLDVGEHDLDRHVAIQPAAIAYFGSLKKEAGRRLNSMKKAYERWQKKKYAEAKCAASSGTQSTKPTVADIEARYIIDNESDIEKWEENIDKAQGEYDTLDSWYEAWRQKSFSIREFVQVDEEERFNSSGSMKSGSSGMVSEKSSQSSDRTRRVRDIMMKNRDRKKQNGG